MTKHLYRIRVLGSHTDSSQSCRLESVAFEESEDWLLELKPDWRGFENEAQKPYNVTNGESYLVTNIDYYAEKSYVNLDYMLGIVT